MAHGKLKRSSESKEAAQIRAAIGVGPDEEVDVQTPQFTRPENEPSPTQAPVGKAGFDALGSVTEKELLVMGMRRWGRQFDGASGQETGPMLWLFPGEWYDSIPDGYPIVDIMFKTEKFEKGQTDNDIRYGCLAFGILRK